MLKITKIYLWLASLAVFAAANFLLPKVLAQEINQETNTDGQGLSDSQIINDSDPEIARLKEEIEKFQNQLTDLDKQKAAYENSIKAKRQEINSLNNQVSILESSVAKLELEIKSIDLETQKTDLEIANLNLEIKHQQLVIDSQKIKLADLLRNIEVHDRQTSYLEVLILKGDLGSFFKEANEVQAVQESLAGELEITRQMALQLDEKKGNLEKRREQLVSLKERMSENTEKLDREQKVKDQLLVSTKGQEASFQKLLAEVKAEQNQINTDIQNLEVEARKRLAKDGNQLATDGSFIWPVPSRKVTAYFHDPDYPFRYVFEHPAIDIGGTPFGTPLRAVRSGYVARVKFDGSTNYAYILLVHTNGLSTVYGHISKPYVKEDDYVVQGEVIGLSGGRPGSPGAGSLTTGAHLHLEVRLNGIPVDPLAYLP